MSDSPENRRKFVRIYRSFMLTYFSVSSPTIPQEVSQINNISQGGMNFSVLAPVAQGECLTVELKTPFLSEGLQMTGEVLECRDKIPGLIYEVRLQFKDLSNFAKEVLAKIEQYARKEA